MNKDISWIECAALILMVIGAINWGLVGTLDFDIMGYFLGDKSVSTRVTYISIGLAGLYYILIKIADYFD